MIDLAANRHPVTLDDLKRTAAERLTHVPPGLRTEVVARFLGYRTYASLRAAFDDRPEGVRCVPDPHAAWDFAYDRRYEVDAVDLEATLGAAMMRAYGVTSQRDGVRPLEMLHYWTTPLRDVAWSGSVPLSDGSSYDPDRQAAVERALLRTDPLPRPGDPLPPQDYEALSRDGRRPISYPLHSDLRSDEVARIVRNTEAKWLSVVRADDDPRDPHPGETVVATVGGERVHLSAVGDHEVDGMDVEAARGRSLGLRVESLPDPT